MMNRRTIQPGQVWVTRKRQTRTPSRRVIAAAGGRVCYSSGGELTRWCGIAAFKAWIRRYSAVATRRRRPRSLILRGSTA